MPICEHDFFTAHTHTPNSRQIQCRTSQPNTTSTQLPTLCCPNQPGLERKFFPVLLLKILINDQSHMTWCLNIRGHSRSKVTSETGRADAALTIHLGCMQLLSLLDKLTLIIKLTVHIKTATHHIWPRLYTQV